MKDSCRELREWKTRTHERKQNKQNNHILAETNNKIHLLYMLWELSQLNMSLLPTLWFV